MPDQGKYGGPSFGEPGAFGSGLDAATIAAIEEDEQERYAWANMLAQEGMKVSSKELPASIVPTVEQMLEWNPPQFHTEFNTNIPNPALNPAARKANPRAALNEIPWGLLDQRPYDPLYDDDNQVASTTNPPVKMGLDFKTDINSETAIPFQYATKGGVPKRSALEKTLDNTAGFLQQEWSIPGLGKKTNQDIVESILGHVLVGAVMPPALAPIVTAAVHGPKVINALGKASDFMGMEEVVEPVSTGSYNTPPVDSDISSIPELWSESLNGFDTSYMDDDVLDLTRAMASTDEYPWENVISNISFEDVKSEYDARQSIQDALAATIAAPPSAPAPASSPAPSPPSPKQQLNMARVLATAVPPPTPTLTAPSHEVYQPSTPAETLRNFQWEPLNTPSLASERAKVLARAISPVPSDPRGFEGVDFFAR